MPNTHEHAKLWRITEVDNMEALHATYIQHAFSRHAHDMFFIGAVLGGVEGLAHERAHYSAPAGSLLLINPGEVHTGYAAHASGWTYRMLYPAPALLSRVAAELTGRSWPAPHFPLPVVDDPVAARFVQQIHEQLEHAAAPIEHETHVFALLAYLIGRYALPQRAPLVVGREQRAVTRMRAYLEANFAQPITLDQLAQLTHFSPSYLVRAFRQYVGLPPHAYLTQVRVERAKVLLRGQQPIAATASATGFVDQSHLTRHFKRLVGVTPGQYQQMGKNIQDRC